MEETKKSKGTSYSSWWDASTWSMVGLVVVCCVIPCLIDGGQWWTVAICVAMIVFVLLALWSIRYRIDGNELVVYTLFIPSSYPIDKIKEIKPTNSILSAPATSLTHRLAITFTDRKVLKSSMPLVISPVRQDQFIKQLLAVNPVIKHLSNHDKGQ